MKLKRWRSKSQGEALLVLCFMEEIMESESV
jgi:hypothetical protein